MNILEIYSQRKSANFVKFPKSEILIFRDPIFLKSLKEGKNKAKTKAFLLSANAKLITF